MAGAHADAQKLLHETLLVLDTMNSLETKALRDDLFGVIKKSLHTVNEQLKKGAGVVAGQFESPPTEEDDARTVVSTSSRRVGKTAYTEFLAEILPFVRQTFPGRAPKVNLTEAADLWQRFKQLKTVEEAVLAAREELAQARQTRSVTAAGLHVATIEE